MSTKNKKTRVDNAFKSLPLSGKKQSPGENTSHVTRTAQYALTGLIALVTFLLYLPCLKNEFLIWDDEAYITNNPLIRSFDVHLVKSAFLEFFVSTWHPLTLISHAIDYAVWGLNPAGHHLTNVIFHALNTAIVVMLVIRLLNLYKQTAKQNAPLWLNDRSILITGGITGLFFGLHPIHVESVAWATERKDLLFAFFYLLSISAYLKYIGDRRHAASAGTKRAYCFDRSYLFSLSLFMLAIFSKPMAISLPIVLLIIDWHPAGRVDSLRTFLHALIEKAPFILLSLGLSVLTLFAQKDAMWLMTNVTLPERMLNAGYSLVAYLFNIAWPLTLSPFHAYGNDISLLSLKYLLPLALAIGISTYLALTALKNKTLFTAWVYYLITLLPALGIIQVGAQARADRFLYLPSLSLFLLIALLIARISGNGFPAIRSTLPKGIGLIIMSFILIALGFLTVRQIGFWQNDLVLWSYAIDVEKSALVYWNRGIAYSNGGQFDRAIKDYDSAILLDPSYYKAYLNRGVAYSELGQFDKAMSDYDRVIEINPGLSDTYNDKGIIYCKAGSFNEAIKQFSSAIKINPADPRFFYNRGQTYRELRASNNALQDFNDALSLKPDFTEAYAGRGEVFLGTGDRERSLADFKKACDLGDGESCKALRQLIAGERKVPRQ